MRPEAEVLRFLVLSDLHVQFSLADGRVASSFLVVERTIRDGGPSPLNDLPRVLREASLTPDAILCPGDLGDRSDQAAIAYAWRELTNLGGVLGCPVIAASGNHDIDSRGITSVDSVGHLRELSPCYPLPDEGECRRYWSDHFGAYEAPSYRVVSLNSAAYHKGNEGEWERGRVTLATIRALERYLVGQQEKALNILVCHHHPHPHPSLRSADSSIDVMVDGNQLIDLLNNKPGGAWLVVHGHKHHPNVSYAAGLNDSPAVISCGSFSAYLYPELATSVRNQVYVVEVPVNALPRLGIVGHITAWDWSAGIGWQPSQSKMFPHRSSFGAREGAATYAYQLASIVPHDTYLRWEDATRELPMLEFVPTPILAEIVRLLEKSHGVQCEIERGRPVQLAKGSQA